MYHKRFLESILISVRCVSHLRVNFHTQYERISKYDIFFLRVLLKLIVFPNVCQNLKFIMFLLISNRFEMVASYELCITKDFWSLF